LLFTVTRRAPLHFPSFPTRRSSDLARSYALPAAPSTAFGGSPPPLRGGGVPTAGEVEWRAAIISPPTAPPARRSVPPWPKPPRRDRKSTRLNSSHVKISYAVFCLKK